jgi:hypothetical protein
MGHAQPVERARIGLAVHPEGGAWFTNGPYDQPGSTPFMGSIGVGVGFEMARHFEVEVGFAKVLSQSHAFAVVPGVDVVNVDIHAGVLWRSLLRYRYLERGSGFVAGAGSATMIGGDFGTVPLLQVELGLERRAASGFYLRAVYQIMEPLVTREWPDPSRCIAGCPLRLDPGKPMFGPQVAVGYVF